MSKAEVIATWGLSLNCTCPECEQDIDLTEDPDFWDNPVAACEHNTPRTDNLEVTCPKCGHGFEVCCEY